ncbi:MAG: SufE family protein [Opitutales bacterium]
MDLAEKAARIEEDFGYLPDPQERFQYLVDLSADAPGLEEAERTEANRVAGCVSAVWVVAEGREGRVQYRFEADSPIVQALAWALADFYGGHTAEEIVATPPAFFDRLRLVDALTENRQRGLQALIARFQRLAVEAVA